MVPVVITGTASNKVMAGCRLRLSRLAVGNLTWCRVACGCLTTEQKHDSRRIDIEMVAEAKKLLG